MKKLTSFCLVATAVLALVAPAYAADEAAAKTGQSPIGYATVAEALEALRVKPGIEMDTQNGWTIATDKANLTLWSFSPKSCPAYPAAVKRVIHQAGTAVSIEMSILCTSPQSACDQLVKDFEILNDKIREEASGQTQQTLQADRP